MRTRTGHLFIIILLFCSQAWGNQDAALFYAPWQQVMAYPQPEHRTAAASFLLVESGNKQVLSQKKARVQRSIASLTKLMTALLVVEAIPEGRFSLEKKYPIHINTAFSALEANAARMALRIGDAPTGDELLEGILIISGNDAALYAAVLVGGSVGGFVVEMNKKAEELGLGNTVFADPTGLSEKNLSTAHDMALLAQHIISYKDFNFLSYTSRPTFFWHYKRSSTNQLLGRYPGVDGLKTGYTEEAGFNIIVTAQQGGRRLLVVVLGIEAESIQKGKELRSREAELFLDYAYATFRYVTITPNASSIEVWGGKKNSLRLLPTTQPVSLPQNWIKKLSRNIEYKQDYYFAPIQAEEALASINYFVLDAEESIPLMRIALRAEESIDKANIFKRLWHKILVFFK